MTMVADSQERRRKPIRLAPELYREGHVFSLTITASGRFPWFRRYLRLAKAVEGVIVRTVVERQSELFAWCIMPDHLHLLIRDADVVAFVRLFKGRSVPFARQIAPSRRLWQRSFFDHALRREESIGHVARYILDNPVRAGLVERAVDYPWSGSLVWPQWREQDWFTIDDVA